MRRGCAMQQANYPVQFAVDYPDRPLDRVSTFFRLVIALPILLVLASVAGGTWTWKSGNNPTAAGAGGGGGLALFSPSGPLRVCPRDSSSAVRLEQAAAPFS